MRSNMDVHTTMPDGTKHVSRNVDVELAWLYKKIFDKRASTLVDSKGGIVTRVTSIYIEEFKDEHGRPRRTCHVTLAQSMPGLNRRARSRRDDAV
jgi:hypothetical protein